MSKPIAPHDTFGVGDNPDCRTAANKWTERERYQTIAAELAESPDRILDVGCVRHNRTRRAYGNLHAQLHLAFPGAEIVGIDFDEEEVQRMDSPGYDLRVMDAEQMDFDEPFSAIVAGELIEHLPNPARFLEQSAKHLTSNGTLVLTTPNPSAFRFFRKAYRNEWTSEDHTCWISPQHLETLIERSGQPLRLDSIEYINPPGGLSEWLFRKGRERIGATTYIASISKTDA